MKKTFINIFIFSILLFSNNITASNFESLEKKANSGDAESLFRIGLVYQYGLGFNIDYNKAMDYYVKAHNAGEVRATTKLGIHFYERGNEALAVRYLQEAAQKNENLSLAYIGKIYEDKKDYRRAFFYYNIAAQRGVSLAKMNIARLHAEGLGTSKNRTEAIKIYREIMQDRNNPYTAEATIQFNRISR